MSTSIGAFVTLLVIVALNGLVVMGLTGYIEAIPDFSFLESAGLYVLARVLIGTKLS